MGRVATTASTAGSPGVSAPPGTSCDVLDPGRGRKPPSGTVKSLGAKNAVLKEIVSTLLAPGRHRLTNVPTILDVELMCPGPGAHRLSGRTGRPRIVGGRPRGDHVPKRPSSSFARCGLRSSCLAPFWPEPARQGWPSPVVTTWGPSHRHAPDGLEAMGANFELVHGELVGRVDGRLKGTEIELPFPSVGATENLLFAGAIAEGETVIVNAASEPEVQDLIDPAAAMGADIQGGGTSLVTIDRGGVSQPGRPPRDPRPP